LPIAIVCLLAAVVLGSVLLLRQCTAPGAPSTPWIFAACDVGQGDGLFLALGPGEAVAVDTGPDPAKEDACASRLGITKVPLVILTHFHADHIDGLPGLLKGRSVGAIETTTVDDPPSGAAQVEKLADAAGIPVTRVKPDEQRAIGPVSWRVLWPQAEHPLGRPRQDADMSMAEDGPGENSGPNNSSIVMAVNVRTATSSLRLLLTGDIETPVQQILMADRPQYLAADVLKVPHHGSANQDPAFLAAVRPSVSVISVGLGNPYGHPSPRTVYLAGADGARVLRTDLDGMVLICAPDGPNGPIPVRADKGDGTVPTAEATPSAADRAREGARAHDGRRHGRARHHAGEPSPSE
jgi:competence protein ComEC